MPADQPTDRELECLRAYVDTGSVRAAALRVGCQEQTLKNHLSTLRSKVGARTNAEAVFLLYPKLAA